MQHENGKSRGGNRNRLALALTVLGGIAQIMPHPPNFTPVGGMSLFAGARLRGWRAYLVPVLLMIVSDAILSLLCGYPLFMRETPVIYGSFLIAVLIGRMLRGGSNGLRIGAAAALCSAQFFLLTNLAVWVWSGMYPHTLAGLAACYVAALPFLGRGMAGDLFYAGALFTLEAALLRLAARAELETARGLSGARQQKQNATPWLYLPWLALTDSPPRMPCSNDQNTARFFAGRRKEPARRRCYWLRACSLPPGSWSLLTA